MVRFFGSLGWANVPWSTTGPAAQSNQGVAQDHQMSEAPVVSITDEQYGQAASEQLYQLSDRDRQFHGQASQQSTYHDGGQTTQLRSFDQYYHARNDEGLHGARPSQSNQVQYQPTQDNPYVQNSCYPFGQQHTVQPAAYQNGFAANGAQYSANLQAFAQLDQLAYSSEHHTQAYPYGGESYSSSTSWSGQLAAEYQGVPPGSFNATADPPSLQILEELQQSVRPLRDVRSDTCESSDQNTMSTVRFLATDIDVQMSADPQLERELKIEPDPGSQSETESNSESGSGSNAQDETDAATDVTPNAGQLSGKVLSATNVHQEHINVQKKIFDKQDMSESRGHEPSYSFQSCQVGTSSSAQAEVSDTNAGQQRGNIPKNFQLQRDFHNRAFELIPGDDLARHRYWIAVFHIGKSPTTKLQEKHFVWMKGNRKTTAHTVWHTFQTAAMADDFVLMLGYDKVDMKDQMGELDLFSDKFICFRAVTEGKEVRRSYFEGLIPDGAELIEID